MRLMQHDSLSVRQPINEHKDYKESRNVRVGDHEANKKSSPLLGGTSHFFDIIGRESKCVLQYLWSFILTKRFV